MKVHSYLSQGIVSRSFLVLAILAFVFAGCASADPTAIAESVACTGTVSLGGFSSVNAALAAAIAHPGYSPLTNQIQIQITGTCTEGVVLSGMSNVQLLGDSSNPPTFTPSATGSSALQILNSNNIYVANINFVGPGGTALGGIPLVQVSVSNLVTFNACNVTGAQGAGLQTYASQVSFSGPSTISQNGLQGIAATGASNISIGGWDSNSTEAVTVENNLTGGISMSQAGYLFVYEYVTISQNGDPTGKSMYAGLSLAGAQASLCCGNLFGPVIDGNYGWGIEAEELSVLTVIGGNAASPFASISNNSQGGIYDLDSWVGVYNNVTIQKNGDNTQANPLGGIDVLSNGSLEIGGGKVDNNFGPGILVSQGSSAVIWNENIAGNTGSGIYVQVNGSVEFDAAATTVTGNTPKDLTCVAGGIAAQDKGQAPTIGTKSCSDLFDLPPRKHKKTKN